MRAIIKEVNSNKVISHLTSLLSDKNKAGHWHRGDNKIEDPYMLLFLRILIGSIPKSPTIIDGDAVLLI